MAGQRSVALGFALLLTLAAVGCQGKEDDGLSPKQVEAGGRLNQIFKRSGGDWDRLTPEEREYVISTTHGDERLARSKWAIRGGAQIGPGGGAANKK